MTTKQECIELLKNSEENALKEVLYANDIRIPTNASHEEHARLLIQAIWKQSHSPIGSLLSSKSLEDIIQVYAQKLNIPIDQDAPIQAQLHTLRSRVLSTCDDIDISDIPPEVLERLQQSVIPSVLGVGAAGGAVTTRWAAYKVLAWTASKWLNIIKLIPQIGPAIITIRSTAGLLARVSGPIGIALAIWSINNRFGPKWDVCLGLLVGLSLCLPEPSKGNDFILLE